MKGVDSPPARAYAEYHKACLAGDSTKLLPLVVYRNQKEFASYDKEMRDMFIELLKMRPAKIMIDKPVVTGDTATFTVKGAATPGETVTGSIKMVLEDNKWKVAEDKWKTTVQ